MNPAASDRTRSARPLRAPAIGAASLVAGVLLWWCVAAVLHLPASRLPTPGATFARAWHLGVSGELTIDIEQTAAEVLQGVLLGTAIGIVLAILFSRAHRVARLVMPVVVVLQVVPKISIAPLIVLWLGLGIGSKIALITLVTFYPILINMTAQLRQLPPSIDDLSRILNIGATRRTLAIDLPYCLPALATGLRLGVLQAVTAAVIGEFIGAQFGLGYLEKQAQDNDDIRLVLTTLMLLCLLAWLLYAIVGLIERRLHARFGGG